LFLAAALRISVPYTLAALGASINERGGVINIALEGMMLHGALAYTLGAFWTGSAWAGVAAAVLAGVVTGALHALVTVRFRAARHARALGAALPHPRAADLGRARRARRRLAGERAAQLHRRHDRRARLHRDRRDDRRQVVAARGGRGLPAVRRRGGAADRAPG